MNKILLSIVLALVAVAGLVWLTWYLAYGMGGIPRGNISVDELRAPVNVVWGDSDVAYVEATSEADALTGLGFTHAARSAWQMVLWRQTALGQLGEWFGDSLLVLDAHTRRLGFDRLARDTYRQMDEEHRALLAAYANGINAALQQREVHLGSEFLALDLRDPAPWQPWHTLAVERLMTWLMTPLPDRASLNQLTAAADTSRWRALADSARAERDDFLATDRLLRRWLHLHGFEHSLAWAVRRPEGTFFFQRHVVGNSVYPLYQDAVLRWGERQVYVTSIPGTLIFPAGRDDDRAWGVLLHGRATYRRASTAERPPPLYDRVRSANGVERLIEIERTGDALLFLPSERLMPQPPPQPDTLAVDSLAVADSLAPPRPPPAPVVQSAREAAPDTLGLVGWYLTWNGFTRATDWPAWRQLLAGTGEWPTFRLITGAAMSFSRAGHFQMHGQPEVASTFPGGLLIGNSSWQTYTAQRLDVLATSSDTLTTVEDWTRDTVSPWASVLAPVMSGLLPEGDVLPDNLAQARTYLENWDYSYDEASIGASIFDTWMRTYFDQTGTLPTIFTVQETQALLQENGRTTPPPAPRPTTPAGPPPPITAPDEEAFARFLLRQSLSDIYVATLRAAVARLERAFGEDQSQWRWENVQPTMRYFPGWDRAMLEPGSLRDDAESRYRPIKPQGLGHPTTLRWGPTFLQRDLPSPAVRALWVHSSSWNVLTIRRNNPRTDGFLARYLPTDERLRPHRLDLSLRPTTEPDVRLRPRGEAR